MRIALIFLLVLPSIALADEPPPGLEVYFGEWEPVDDPAEEQARIQAVETTAEGLPRIIRRYGRKRLLKSVYPETGYVYQWTDKGFEQSKSGLTMKVLNIDGVKRLYNDIDDGKPTKISYSFAGNQIFKTWSRDDSFGWIRQRVTGDTLKVVHNINSKLFKVPVEYTVTYKRK